MYSVMRCDESGLNVCAKVLKSLDKRNICPACVTDLLSISRLWWYWIWQYQNIAWLWVERPGYPVDVKLSSSIQPSLRIIIWCSISHKEHLQRTHSWPASQVAKVLKHMLKVNSHSVLQIWHCWKQYCTILSQLKRCSTYQTLICAPLSVKNGQKTKVTNTFLEMRLKKEEKGKPWHASDN